MASHILRHYLLGAMLLVSFSAFSEDKLEIPKLGEGEGYLLLGLYVHDIIPSKIMLKGDGFLSTESMTDLIPGDQYDLIAVKAGEYTFDRVYNNALLNDKIYWDLEAIDFTVKVEPGTISYGGHLISEVQASRQAIFRLRNRGSQALEYLEYCCSSLLENYKLKYTGKVTDPYLTKLQEKK
ncbi:hypothetical protein [Pseudoteredinibacter isoporae]|uniref:hypothetical protein n=1 Tax=Pseudoteredinibacter isoporae TaxID=570281 RepID=UPI003109F3A4